MTRTLVPQTRAQGWFWRLRAARSFSQPAAVRWNLGLWAWFAKRPTMYRLATRAGMGALSLLARGKGAFRSMPFAGGWIKGRDLPAPERGGTFMARYAKMQRGR